MALWKHPAIGQAIIFIRPGRSFNREHSIEQLQEVVRRSQKVKALGTRHSFNDIADSPENLVSLKYFDKILHLDREQKTVTVEADVRYGELCQWLDREDFALHNLASLYGAVGQLDSALAYYQHALQVARRVRSRDGEGTTLNAIGGVYAEAGQPDSAVVYYRRALAVAREVRDPISEAHVLTNLGELHRESGHSDSALTYYRQGRTLFRRMGQARNPGVWSAKSQSP